MALPTAHGTFVLPSLYDDLELQCRLYFPRRKQDAETQFVKGFAIFAHPYAPLGGSYDDPVVNLVGSTLVRRGYVLATFNFRGAEGSHGHTSWSGKPELGDYVTLMAFMLCFINGPDVQDYVASTHTDQKRSPSFILGGYSYGSMIASHLPSLRTVQAVIENASEGSSENEISIRAHDIAKAFLGYAEAQQYRGRSSLRASDANSPTGKGVTVGGYESATASRRISRESSRRSIDMDRVRHSVDKVRNKLIHRTSSGQGQEVTVKSLPDDRSDNLPRVAHLLVSPILGIVSGFTTMFQKLEFERRGKNSADGSIGRQPSITDQFTRSPTCVVYGTKDTFTSARKLRSWCEELKNVPSSMFTFHEIIGAGHFWHEPGSESQMTKAIAEWVSSTLS